MHPAIYMLLAEHIYRIFSSLQLRHNIVAPNRDTEYTKIEEFIELASDYTELRNLLKTAIADTLQYNFEQRNERGRESIISARQFIDAHYAEALSLETVAEAIHLSATYFSTLFKKEAGESFVDYLTRVRMEKAKELLRTTNDPISAIAEQVGIPDSKYFSKLFMKTIRIKPSAYRKLYR